MRARRLVVGLLLVVALGGCASRPAAVGLAGSGNLVTKELSCAGFDRVRATGFFDVTIRQGGRFAVSVTADDNLFEHVAVTLQGSELTFGLHPGGGYTLESGTIKAAVTMPRLTSVTVDDNASLIITACQADLLLLTVAGRGSLAGRLEVGALQLGAADNAVAMLTGNAQTAVVSGSGNSTLDLSGLAADSARVTLGDLANATVNASARLDYTVTGLAQLTYLGQPLIGEQTVSGDARVAGQNTGQVIK